MGVQFASPKGYSQVRAGEVWQLFRPEYPLVSEREALPPSFETFGLQHSSHMVGGVSLVSGALHDRFWFMRQSGDELIQFQQDRLLHNWRKVGDQSNEYPRFETMVERFRAELASLETYVATLTPQLLNITQCEISYINHIVDSRGKPKPSDWLTFASFEGVTPEDFTASFREIIRDAAGQPIGRFICECSSIIASTGRPVIALVLTVRGAPAGANTASAIDLITRGRDIIVRNFARLTTAAAHKSWDRKQ
jgi:uncharacterized protein (TIGR04255 family)